MIRVPGSSFGIAMSVDCNARLVALDPYEGGKAAVAEAARNVASQRSPTAGDHQLPQFREPRKTRGLLPVPRGVPGDCGRLPRFRHSGHWGQRLLL